MLTNKKDETEQRLNALLQKLSGITFVPENWNEAAFWTTLSETGLTRKEVIETEESLFFNQLIDLKWPWEQIEKLADIMVALDEKAPGHLLIQRAKHLYGFIQKESKIFSFEIMKKMENL